VSMQPELALTEDTPGPDAATASALIGVLHRHYLRDERHPAGIFASGIQAPGSLRKADLIWLGCTAAAGSELVGHEIKISRSDLQRELADLTKSDPWQRYCDRWWLVIPHAGIVQGLELPDSWGVMLPPSGRRGRAMTIHHPAPALKPDEQAPALRTLAAWVHWRQRDATARAKDLQDRLERAERNLREQELTTRHRADPAAKMVGEIIAKLGGTWTSEYVGDWKRRVKPEDLVTALKDLGEVYRRRDEIERHLSSGQESLKSAQTQITLALAEMDEAVRSRMGESS